MKRTLLAANAALFMLATVASAQTIEEVGDPDSFGRDVIHLGIANADPAYIAKDCTQQLAAGFECTVALPPPAITEFSHTDLDSIQLPARASNSRLCFAVTPTIVRSFRNDTTAVGNATLTTRSLITIESSVLDNPALVNPATGEPFGGKIDLTFFTRAEDWRLQPGDFMRDITQLTRACQGALISKRTLVNDYGLSQSQANSVFNNRITVRIGSSASARFVESLSYGWAIRLYGDRR